MAQRSLIQERRRKILEYITKNRKAEIRQLSELLGETEITIRRDLIELEKIVSENGYVYRLVSDS